MKCENYFCDNYSELKTQNCKRYSGWIFDDCEARKNFSKLVEEKFTSDNSDYAAAIRVINEFSANDCRGTEIRDLWNWLCECINSSKPNHSKNSNSSTKER